MNTFFVLETLETLRKAGRLSNLKALVANTLNIKPVMGSTKEGMIQQLGQARGMKKALNKMVEDMLKVTKNCQNRVLAIAHCNCPERAQFVKEAIEKVAKFKKIVIVNTAGVSSMYANDGGLIMAVQKSYNGDHTLHADAVTFDFGDWYLNQLKHLIR